MRKSRFTEAARNAVSSDRERRCEAAISLELMGGEGAIELLLQLLHDQCEDVRSFALSGLHEHGIPVDDYLSLLTHPTATLRKMALKYAQPIEKKDRVKLAAILPALAALQDPNEQLRCEAAIFLKGVSAELLQCHPEIGALQNTQIAQDWRSDPIRSKIGEALFYSDPSIDLAQKFLKERASHEEASLRLAWILALYRHRKLTRGCLESSLGDSDSTVRAFCTSLIPEFMGLVDPQYAERGLWDHSPLVRREAAYAIWRMERVSEPGLLQLRSLLHDPFTMVSLAASAALRRFTDRVEIPLAELQSLLDVPDYRIRFDAICLIPWICPERGEAVLLLIEQLASERNPARFWSVDNAIRTILSQVQDAGRALEKVRDLRGHSNPEVRVIAEGLIEYIRELH